MNEKETKIYNYGESVLMSVSGYYGYEYVKLSIEEIKKHYKDGFKKYCYLDNNKFGFLVFDGESIFQDAEVISMIYRIIEELRIENILVKIKASKDYDLAKLQEYLEYLDVDYEISDSNYNSLMTYEIVEQVKDKEVVLASGAKSDYLASECYLDNIVNILSVIYEDREFDTLTQVTIVGESEEERIAAMKLAQDLRWCEIKVDTDTLNKSKSEQMKDIKSNFIIVMDNDDLNKGLMKVIDNVTHEETMVDEAEIIDYIVSNM